ncbi:hypothetical protein [Parasphingorhabdus pacifica]
METQSYYQNGERAPAEVDAQRASRQLVGTLVALVVVLLALPAQMVISPDGFAESIARSNPTLNPSQLDLALKSSIAFAAITHVAFGAIATWLVIKVLRARQWARVALTVFVVLALWNSLYSAAAGPEYYWAVIAGNVILVVIIGLLWLPGPVRRLFTEHRPGPGRAARG